MAKRKPGTGKGADTTKSAAATADPFDRLTEFEAAVVRVLLATEPGDVMAYGEVAAEAGYPGAARAVGNVLKRIDDLPWWRVVTAAGRLIPHHPKEQARRLAAEGVPTRDGRISL
ncbi:MAG: MGMT family protein [Actinomycetota bacterium]